MAPMSGRIWVVGVAALASGALLGATAWAQFPLPKVPTQSVTVPSVTVTVPALPSPAPSQPTTVSTPAITLPGGSGSGSGSSTAAPASARSGAGGGAPAASAATAGSGGGAGFSSAGAPGTTAAAGSGGRAVASSPSGGSADAKPGGRSSRRNARRDHGAGAGASSTAAASRAWGPGAMRPRFALDQRSPARRSKPAFGGWGFINVSDPTPGAGGPPAHFDLTKPSTYITPFADAGRSVPLGPVVALLAIGALAALVPKVKALRRTT